MTISRRHFLAAGSVAALAPLQLAADPLALPIGFQSYPVREMIAQDFPGTLRRFAKVGYKTVEMCSPAGYAQSGFGPLTKLTATAMRRTIEAAGLRCESCHFQFRELNESLDERLAFAKDLGLKQMVLASFNLPPAAPMAQWMQACDRLNRIGEQTQQAGIQTVFHNHHFEFRELDGALIYGKLMDRLDPAFVKMQFQVAVISIGFEAATFLTKYPGRFASLHLADWSPAEKKAVPIGTGVVQWKQLFAAARTGGIKNYFVEMNLEAMESSYPYLHALQV